MRISIIGSHSTGKTCLAKSLYQKISQKYPNQVTLIHEIPRQLRAKGLPLNQQATLETYINYIYEQLKSERLARTKYVISDRCLVDPLAYILAGSNVLIPREFKDMLKEIIFREADYFDLYVYLSIEFPLIIDDIRPADIKYQKLVDEKINYLLHIFSLPVLKVSGSIEERTNLVIEEIHKHYDNSNDLLLQ